MATIALSKLVDKLQQHYGAPVPPPSSDPLELIIWENIAYLASDERRAAAFATLKQTIGTRPEQIPAAKHSSLAAIGKAGILPDVSAEKLLAIAKIAYEEFDSDLRSVLKIGVDQLPAASPTSLPLDKDGEAKRAAVVEQQFGDAAPGVVQYTTDVLFRDLWLRPDLAPRDRSLVTVSALIANGQVAQIPYHLNRAMDNSLRQMQAAEVVTQLAFYAGWPNAFSALPVVKDVFEKRPH
jgi:alkylhydroperoxidase/carboxymuconolactone decarboxylase family protein YurZ